MLLRFIKKNFKPSNSFRNRVLRHFSRFMALMKPKRDFVLNNSFSDSFNNFYIVWSKKLIKDSQSWAKHNKVFEEILLHFWKSIVVATF